MGRQIRTGIDHEKRTHGSKRARNGLIRVVKEKQCLRCNHHKTFSKRGRLFCTRCGFEHS